MFIGILPTHQNTAVSTPFFFFHIFILGGRGWALTRDITVVARHLHIHHLGKLVKILKGLHRVGHENWPRALASTPRKGKDVKLARSSNQDLFS
uniref:Uncharacterized protein n=1 Tax=Ixodes ricinus TaxID=34613 RepID=A0A6B0U2W9_IXORI